MAASELRLPTQKASRYLQQLAKHFGHKVPVEYTPTSGEVTLPFGNCTMLASDDRLKLVVTGEPQNLVRLENFIADHLSRFAFRENPTLTWHRSA